MLEVIVAGNVGIDTNVYLPPDFAPEDLREREAAFTSNVDGVGQAGGYASLGYARLGRRVGFVGFVGDDPLGRWVESELRAAGVEPLLFTDPAGTCRSVNLMRPDGTRNNFYDGKSHMTVAPELEACRRFISGARLLHLHIPNWGRELIPIAKALGVKVACDLQDVREVRDPYRSDFIRGADILFCSTVESKDDEALARALAAMNPRATIVLGRGARGAALFRSDHGFQSFPAVRAGAPVVDTNGAGDSLAVGFLVAHVLEGRPAETAIVWGQTAARHACTLRGDSASQLITRAELEARLGPTDQG
jgi:sugar/nucleoside kinase (ribokinase family)